MWRIWLKTKDLFIDLVDAHSQYNTYKCDSFPFDHWLVCSMKAIEFWTESHLFAAFLGEWYDEGGFLHYPLSIISPANAGILLQLVYSNGRMKKKKTKKMTEKEWERSSNCGFATFRLSAFYEDPFTTSIYFEWER